MQKQEVLIDFVQNKAVLQAIYTLMFNESDMRASKSNKRGSS